MRRLVWRGRLAYPVRIGCRTREPGLRSLDHLDAAVADDVIRRLTEVLRDRVANAR